MAAGKLPPWLEELMQEALGSAEWETLSESIMQEVQDKLDRRGLKFFSDLPDADKGIFIDELEQDMQLEESYETFFRRLGGSLDKQLLQTAMKGDMADDERAAMSVAQRTQAELERQDAMFKRLIELVGDGAGALLKRHPNRIRDVKVAGNRALLGELRRIVWDLNLRNAEAGQEYIRQAEGHRLNVVSSQDIEIAKACRVLMDTEFSSKNLSEFLLPIKQLVSYVHARHGGPVDGPVRYIAVSLVYGLNHANEQPLEGARLVEALMALLQDAGYESLFTLSDGSIAAGGAWGGMVDEILSLVAEADPAYLEMLMGVLGNVGKDLDGQLTSFTDRLRFVRDLLARKARGTLTGKPHEGPWNTAGSSGASQIVLLAQLCLPMVQRLFVGMLEGMEATCAVWDTMIILGFQLIPNYVASYLLALKPAITELVPEDAPAEVLGWALNATKACLKQSEIEVVMETHFMKQIRKSLRLRHVRDESLDFYMPLGVGEPTRLTARSLDKVGSLKQEEQLMMMRLGSAMAEKSNSAVQTGDDVTDINEVVQLLSPRLHRRQEFSLLRPPTPAKDKTRDTSLMTDVEDSISSPTKGKGQEQVSRTALGGNSVELWYANRIYSVKIPVFEPYAYKLSAVADLAIQNPDNEDLLSAVVRHERRVPCPVARIQGTTLRQPSATNLDVILFQVLSAAFPTVEDDYTQPMMRVDLPDPSPGQATEIYLHPLQEGDVLGSEVVEEISVALDLHLTHEQMICYARLLESYSKQPHRERPQRAATDAAVAAATAVNEIGVDIRIDSTLDHMLHEVRRNDAGFIIEIHSQQGMVSQGKKQTRKDLSEVLRLPEDCIHVTGLHQFKGHIMVEVNISSSTNAFQPRTCMHSYDDLVALVGNPYSTLHALPCIGKAVRVILRGRPHHYFERGPPKPMTPPGHQAEKGEHPSVTLSKVGALADVLVKRNAENKDKDKEKEKASDGSKPSGGSRGGSFKVASEGSVKSLGKLSDKLKKLPQPDDTAEGTIAAKPMDQGNAEANKAADVGKDKPDTAAPTATSDKKPDTAKPATSASERKPQAEGGAEPAVPKEGGGAEGKLPGALSKLKMSAKVVGSTSAFEGGTKIYYTRGKEKVGPFDIEGMRREMSEGHVTAKTYIWYKALGRTWLKLQEDAGLSQALGVPFVEKKAGPPKGEEKKTEEGAREDKGGGGGGQDGAKKGGGESILSV